MGNNLQFILFIALALPATASFAQAGESPLPREHYDSIEAGALAAFYAMNSDWIEHHQPNRQATLKLLADPKRHIRVDLNQDDRPDVIVRNGVGVDYEGRVYNVDGVTGNCSWCVLAAEEGDAFRIVSYGCGFRPAVLETRTHGWLDLASGGAAGGKVGRKSLLRYDGRKYVGQWGIGVVGLGDGWTLMTPTPINDALVRRLLDLPADQPITYRTAGCFTRDLGDDGKLDMLLQLDELAVGKETLTLNADGATRANFFHLVRDADEWRVVHRAINRGGLYMPMETRNQIILTVQPKVEKNAYEGWRKIRFKMARDE